MLPCPFDHVRLLKLEVKQTVYEYTPRPPGNRGSGQAGGRGAHERAAGTADEHVVGKDAIALRHQRLHRDRRDLLEFIKRELELYDDLD